MIGRELAPLRDIFTAMSCAPTREEKHQGKPRSGLEWKRVQLAPRRQGGDEGYANAIAQLTDRVVRIAVVGEQQIDAVVQQQSPGLWLRAPSSTACPARGSPPESCARRRAGHFEQ